MLVTIVKASSALVYEAAQSSRYVITAPVKSRMLITPSAALIMNAPMIGVRLARCP